MLIGTAYTGLALAVQAFKKKNVRRIVLTRQAVSSEENLGFLPGNIKEKLDLYPPLYSAWRNMIWYEKLVEFLEKNTI
ncbi:MAG: PhoH family protein [Flavobacteriales bacterium]